MTDHALMLARLTNVPLMVTSDYLDGVLGLLASRQGVDLTWREPPNTPDATEGRRYTAMRPQEERAVHDGLALIGVDGSLAHKSGRMQGMSSMMRSYSAIRRDLDAALEDDDVTGIVFDIDSPGGEVSGNFALSEYIGRVRDRKPSMALADEFATSAAYNIGAAAGELVAPSGALVGSIGVILAHVSEARALTNEGIDVTLIRAGAEKARGNSVEPLEDSTRAALQTSVNRTYGRFVGIVSRHRGMEAGTIRATEARVYDAEEALELGLIDAVMSADDALLSFAERSRERSVDRTTVPVSQAAGPTPTTREVRMANEEQGAEPGTTTTTASEQPVDNTAAIEKASADATTAERERVQAIYALPSANTSEAHRTMAGEFVALGMSVEQCDGLLKKMPVPAPAAKAEAPEDTDTLGDLMGKEGADAAAVESVLSDGEGDPAANAAIADAAAYRRDTESHIRYADRQEGAA